ncbi:MAG: sarcosine oxidase subunit delta [Candidatus Bathyarchaeia archaeon]
MTLGFLIKCPNCGQRSVYEFHFGGEFLVRPSQQDSENAWYEYAYGRSNLAGVQEEWWYHRFGCKRWFLAERNTMTNEVLRTFTAAERLKGKDST